MILENLKKLVVEFWRLDSSKIHFHFYMKFMTFLFCLFVSWIVCFFLFNSAAEESSSTGRIWVLNRFCIIRALLDLWEDEQKETTAQWCVWQGGFVWVQGARKCLPGFKSYFALVGHHSRILLSNYLLHDKGLCVLEFVDGEKCLKTYYWQK